MKWGIYSPVDDVYLVVWQGGRTNNNRPDVYKSRGQGIGSEFGIQTGNRSYTDPDVVYDPNSGQFLVIWSHQTPKTTQHDLTAAARSAQSLTSPTQPHANTIWP